MAVSVGVAELTRGVSMARGDGSLRAEPRAHGQEEEMRASSRCDRKGTQTVTQRPREEKAQCGQTNAPPPSHLHPNPQNQ